MSLNTTQVLKYINLAREYPKYYLSLLDEQIMAFTDDLNMQIDSETIYQTIEGKSIWEDAKLFLMNQEPLRPFDLHQGLTKAATDHARDIIKHSSTGHQGSDGSTFIDRVQRYCKKGKGSMIELLGTTHLIPGKNSIELALLNLIIDDGVANRGHRKALFNKQYKHIGISFIINKDSIYSVISLSQINLQTIKCEPQTIATSTSHLKTMTEITDKSKEGSNSHLKSKENCIDELKPATRNSKELIGTQNNPFTPPINDNDQMWTLKNVVNQQKVSSKKVLQKQIIEQPQNLSPEPSIFKQVDNSIHSRSSINNLDLPNQKPVVQSQIPSIQVHRSSKKQCSQHSVKQNSLKSSQQSITSEQKRENISRLNQQGLSSKVQEYKVKNSMNSPFFKSQTSSCFGSTAQKKKIVEKKETMRTWSEDEFLVKEVTTVVKYQDGSIEDFVQKHSVLKTTSSSYIKQASL